MDFDTGYNVHSILYLTLTADRMQPNQVLLLVRDRRHVFELPRLTSNKCLGRGGFETWTLVWGISNKTLFLDLIIVILLNKFLSDS